LPALSPITIILAVLPVYLLMAGGAALRRIGVLRSDHDIGVMHVIFSVMLPCYILDHTLGAEVLRDARTLITGVGLGFSLIIVGIAIGYFVGKLIGLAPGQGRRTFALAAGCQNFGFTAVPVVEILWGGSAVALLFVHNLGVEVAIWSVGVMLVTGGTGIPWKRLINGPIIAVAIGLTLVALRIDDKVTGPVREAISMIGIGAFPLAIMMTGATIMDLATKEKPSWRIMTAACVVRLALAPAAIILCAKYIPMAVELKQILVVQAAMPAALGPILIARMYDGRPAVAVQVVVATTVISLFTLPYIITFGIRFLELTPLSP
jgi:malate permease and related proteins